MENQKKNNGTLVGILIGIIIMLLVVGGLFATGTIGFKTNTANDNEQTASSNQTGTNDNTVKENEITYFYDVKDLKVTALPEYKVFDDISNNKNVVERIVNFGFDKNYAAFLDLVGNVTVQKYSKSENEKGIIDKLNVTGVIDIVHFDVPSLEVDQLLYMLTDNGNVYYYRIGDIEKNSFNATKVESVSNVKKIFISNFTKTNAGGSWALFAITGDNDCIMIQGESV